MVGHAEEVPFKMVSELRSWVQFSLPNMVSELCAYSANNKVGGNYYAQRKKMRGCEEFNLSVTELPQK
jgi:hypothetical protein